MQINILIFMLNLALGCFILHQQSLKKNCLGGCLLFAKENFEKNKKL